MFGVVGATSLNSSQQRSNRKIGFGEPALQLKSGPVSGWEWYTLAKPVLPIKKSHATEPFEKEGRLGAAELCLFCAIIVAHGGRFCQYLTEKNNIELKRG